MRSQDPPSTGGWATVALIPGLGTTTRMWDGVVSAIASRAQGIGIMRMDLPGHGSAPPHIGFTVEDLADAAIAEVELRRTAGSVYVAGLSMGGAVALEVARRGPDWLAGFGMFNSAARFGDVQGWATLAEQVQAQGTSSLRASSAEGWFSATARDSNLARQLLDDLAAVDEASFLACCSALARYRGDHDLDRIAAPALLVGAANDTATPAGPLRSLAGQLPRGRYASFPRGRHLAPVECPVETAELLVTFVSQVDGQAGGNA